MSEDRVQVKKVNLQRFYFFSILLVFYAFVSPTFANSSESKTELYRYNKLTLQNHPVRQPRSLPGEFIPEGSDLIHSTELKSERGYFDTRESFLLFTHSFKKKQMEVYYASIFQALVWKVLQEEITDQKTLIMVESSNKKVITIQIEATDAGSRVKLFYKKSGS